MCVMILLSLVPQRSSVRLVDIGGNTKDVFSGGGAGRVTEKYECPLLTNERMSSTAEETAYVEAWRHERIGCLQIDGQGKIAGNGLISYGTSTLA